MTQAIKITPMLQQYLEIKQGYPDAILFYRMGDFYEMFFEDAIVASKILGIALTSRNNKDEANKVPLCGFPYHAASTYLAKLIKAGHRVAICEQIEDQAMARDGQVSHAPGMDKERPLAKGIVKREVIRVVSPGVVTDAQLLDDKSNLYVAAISRQELAKAVTYGLSFLDLSTGEFLVGEFQDDSAAGDLILDQLTRMAPAELLVSHEQSKLLTALLQTAQTLLPGLCITERAETLFHRPSCEELLTDHFQVLNLAGFGCGAMQQGIICAGVLLDYIRETQKTELDHIEVLRPIDLAAILQIDESSRRNLELTQTIIGTRREGSLLAVLDQTCTPMGARLLHHHLLFPLQDVARITARLDAVANLFTDRPLRQELRAQLATIYDLERLNSRMVLGSANGRDMLAMRQSLAILPAIKKLLGQCSATRLLHISAELDPLIDLHQLLSAAIHEDAPITLRDGNLIRPGYNQELDELVHLLRDGRQMILELENKERAATGIAKLKVGYNRVFGYFIEVSRLQAAHVPSHYIRKQTLVNAERFITPELKDFEDKVLGAQEKRLDLEYQLFTQIRKQLAAESPRLLKSAQLLAQVDFFTALAECAHRYHYCRPEVNGGEAIIISEGRHPVIERSLPIGKFVPNDVTLDQDSQEVLIITGPNMAGKSTVLRQTALIVLMAQMGSFVPADRAVIGVVDRIFTRVGAMDDLRRGQSTFMVEMNETANILNNATDRSLVILDEIGRGTSTFDGLAIAWAVAEDLVTKNNRGVKTLFATHYHELIDLARTQPRVRNYSIAVREWNDTIIFLHKLVEGGTNRSYGIQVAALAGVPARVVQRAGEILANIETGELDQDGRPCIARDRSRPTGKKHPSQLSLFTPADPLRDYLQQIKADTLSPRQALDIIYEIELLLQK